MGGATQPFLYDAPSKFNVNDPYNGFNPKAVTQASRRPPPKPKPKPTGPLIDFNRHPDSYLVVPQRSEGMDPWSRRTKAVIKWTRWVQLGARVLQLLGAVGMLICVIMIRNTADNEGWIIRLPPGLDILLSLYGIYHLIRPAKARTPASSASYHFFTLIMDAGLIPFYVFIAILSNSNYFKTPDDEGRWITYLAKTEATNGVLLAAWYIAATDGGIHLLSMLMGLYLVLVFRKIARLPPDMNPLEDNLTRRASKHKHKNSEISINTTSDPRDSVLSHQKLSLAGPGRGNSSNPRSSVVSESREVPFFHTRTDSATSFSPHNPESARLSRADLQAKIYSQSQSARASRADVYTREHGDLEFHSDDQDSQRRYSRAQSKAQSQRGSRSLVPSKHDSIVAESFASRPARESKKSDLQSDNWFVVSHDESPPNGPNFSNEYNDIRNDSIINSSNNAARFIHEPLRMNPPTPVGSQDPRKQRSLDSPVSSDHTNTPTMTSTTTGATNETSRSSYYDGLRTAKQRLGSTLVGIAAPNRNQNASPPKSLAASIVNSTSSRSSLEPAQTGDATTSSLPAGNTRVSPRRYRFSYEPVAEDEVSSEDDDDRDTAHVTDPRAAAGENQTLNYRRNQLHQQQQQYSAAPRVVSRTGVDIDVAGPEADLGLGMGRIASGGGAWRRRDVSGKLAEEGRSGRLGAVW